MKFKIDENLPADLGEDLRQLGHDAATVHEEGLAGVDDHRLVEVAREESRVLLTLDKGIANLAEYPHGSHAGIVLFRPGSQGRSVVLDFVLSRLADVLKCELQKRITVVTSDRVRSSG